MILRTTITIDIDGDDPDNINMDEAKEAVFHASRELKEYDFEYVESSISDKYFEDGTPVEIYENPEGTYVDRIDS